MVAVAHWQAQATEVAPADVLAVARDLNANVLVERTRQIRTLITGALAGVNINQLGPAGSAKSMMSRALCERIVGGRYFSKALHAQMPADALIGGYDMPEFARSGEFRRNVTHFMPDAHVVFLDEWSRANGPTPDAMLPMLNAGERLAEGDAGMVRTPILFVVLASNFMPASDDQQFGALVDRITLSQYIDYIQSDESFSGAPGVSVDTVRAELCA
jgi:MoxR-like ATPase